MRSVRQCRVDGSRGRSCLLCGDRGTVQGHGSREGGGKDEVARLTREARSLTEALTEQKERADELEADIHTRVAEETAAQIKAYCNKVQAEQSKKDLAHFEDLEKYKKKLAEATAIIENECPEEGQRRRTRYCARTQGGLPRRQGRTHRKGVNRFDVHHTVMHLGKPVGIIAHESKNTSRWLRDYSVKFRHDQLKAEAAYGVLWTTTMPPDAETDVTQVDEVFVCKHRLGVEITRMLRQACIKISLVENYDDAGLPLEVPKDYVGSPQESGIGHPRLARPCGPGMVV